MKVKTDPGRQERPMGDGTLANVSHDRWSSQSTYPTGTPAPSRGEAPDVTPANAYVKPDSNIANRKCIFSDLFSNRASFPQYFTYPSQKLITLFIRASPSEDDRTARRWRYWYPKTDLQTNRGKTKSSIFIMNGVIQFKWWTAGPDEVFPARPRL